jgi:hypothetical protein
MDDPSDAQSDLPPYPKEVGMAMEKPSLNNFSISTDGIPNRPHLVFPKKKGKRRSPNPRKHLHNQQTIVSQQQKHHGRIIDAFLDLEVCVACLSFLETPDEDVLEYHRSIWKNC